jgi:hypothetical protein
MTPSKKHHFVPQFILRNFTDAKGQLFVKRHGNGRWRPSNPNAVGFRNNAHRVSKRFNEDPSFYEKQMALVESESAPLIQELIASDLTLVPDVMKASLQGFLVMNQMREPGLLEGILPKIQAEFTEFTHLPGVQELIQDLGIAALTWPAPGSEDDTAVSSYRGRSAAYAEAFGAFRWNIVRFTDDPLVLGDRLVCTYGQVRHFGGAPSMTASHFGAEGLLTCDRVTVALSSRVGLLLSRKGRPEMLNAVAFNRATILNSQSFIAHHPLWRSAANAVVVQAADEQIGQVEAWRLAERISPSG